MRNAVHSGIPPARAMADPAEVMADMQARLEQAQGHAIRVGTEMDQLRVSTQEHIKRLETLIAAAAAERGQPKEKFWSVINNKNHNTETFEGKKEQSFKRW